MSHDALRMRLRRLCEVKPRTKKCHVDADTHEQWKKGGESREWLEIALAEAVERLGTRRTNTRSSEPLGAKILLISMHKGLVEHNIGSERSRTSLAARQNLLRGSWW